AYAPQRCGSRRGLGRAVVLHPAAVDASRSTSATLVIALHAHCAVETSHYGWRASTGMTCARLPDREAGCTLFGLHPDRLDSSPI
ncbi:MAG TPA: hypothetical protein VIG47_18215, partial [Gemmatimonadaceae bacterium]